jgi:phosphoglycerol transferase MdoB-like AlkP superfamily enzyme
VLSYAARVARLQRGIVEETRAFAERRIDPSHSVFRFVHFSVPHFPFVFTAEGFHPPFDPLRTSPDDAYVRQIEYVDCIVGDIVDRMKKAGTYDGPTIAILADHGFRFGGRESNERHIPFIVKAAGQRTAEYIAEARPAEFLLPELLERSCAPDQ